MWCVHGLVCTCVGRYACINVAPVQVWGGVCVHEHVCKCAGVCLWVRVHECVCVCTCRYGVLHTHLCASTGGGQRSMLGAIPHEPSTFDCLVFRQGLSLACS